jgi:hypothetical protein
MCRIFVSIYNLIKLKEIVMKLNATRFALAGGIYFAAVLATVTVLALLKVPGYLEFATWLKLSFYGFYGYSVSWLGVLVGAFWGFVGGYVNIGILIWLYNQLSGSK